MGERKLYRIPVEVVVPADSFEDARDAADHVATSLDTKYVLDQHYATMSVLEPDSHNERGERVFVFHPETEPEVIPSDDLDDEEGEDAHE